MNKLVTSSLTRRQALSLGATAAAALGLAACGGPIGSSPDSAESPAESDAETLVSVAATSVPHAEILSQVVKGLLAEEGYDLEITEFEDYVQPNTVVEDGQIDANYFQHINYLDSFNQENGTHLVSVGYVHYEPFGLYAGKSGSLADIADGAQVAVPDDTTNEARALLLLEQEGLITLAEGAGVTATKNDIVDNPYHLDIVEAEAANVPHILADVDFGVINGNYALEAGLAVSDALAIESTEGEAAQQYGNVLVVKEGNENLPKIQALFAALTSDEVRDFINHTYEGAVVALF
ncbi:MAG: MetQ/NlpA family ABC transporter substrate-binding protein [Atopobiaceae bacterium]|nr:MetQ/NlpA family ABC transporter substrate-binding protein [Atopobiaceae bacterium]